MCAHDPNGRHLSTTRNTKVCVCLVRRRSVTRRYSRVLRDRGNAGRLWKLHGASEREWCNVIHIHTHGEKRSALCVRYLILLVVNIVCVFEWYKTHPLAQLHRKSEMDAFVGAECANGGRLPSFSCKSVCFCWLSLGAHEG